MIYYIAAVDEQWALGNEGQLLCHIPLDLQYFKKKTVHQSILMGRKTFESIGYALPHRENFVLTHDKKAIFPHAITITSVEEALKKKHSEDLWIIGGAMIFEAYLPMVDQVFLTRIHHTFPNADVFFPQLNDQDWYQISEEFHGVSEKNSYPLTFEVWGKVTSDI